MPEAPEARLTAWAREQWPGGDPGPLEVEPIPADGSPRRFLRLRGGGGSLVAMANPEHPAENRAWAYLARHLDEKGLPVAWVLAQDLEQGFFLMADLGRRLLQEEARDRAGDEAALLRLYEPVLAVLARLQAQGGDGLDTAICFDGPELTPAFLREREVGYFISEMVQGALGIAAAELPAGLAADLDRVAKEAGQAQPRGLVHRDFQSRNIIWQEARPWLVDFQGARLGPAQYDAASLINDPYVDLGWDLREAMVERYIDLRAELGDLDRGAFRRGYPWVALSRIMQALGAYAFLTRRRGRRAFAAYVAPALATLRRLLAAPPLNGLGALGQLAARLPQNPAPEIFAPLEEALT